MLKRAMDVFYASVGAAIKVTDATPNWRLQQQPHFIPSLGPVDERHRKLRRHLHVT
jgi:hypothetical protein